MDKMNFFLQPTNQNSGLLGALSSDWSELQVVFLEKSLNGEMKPIQFRASLEVAFMETSDSLNEEGNPPN